MSSLVARLVCLCVLIAVIATAVAAVSAGRAAGAALDAQEEHTARRALEAWQAQVADALATLDYETRDYATWDDLYAQLPVLDPAWSDINLQPGSHEGSLVGAMVIVDAQGRLRGRYRPESNGGIQPTPSDPAPLESLAPLLAVDAPARGVALLGGQPALFARRPILPSNGQGPHRGYLIGLAYTERAATRHRLAVAGWTATYAGDHHEIPAVARDDRLSITWRAPAIDGSLPVLLATEREESRRIRTRTVLAVYGTGALAALLAAVLGIVLALHWLRPLRQLVRECQQPQAHLSDGGPLEETRALALAFKTLLAAERASRDDLAAALDRARHLGAVHRAFLAGLSQEIGLPVARLAGLLQEGLARGSLPPEDVAEARTLVELLEVRLGDAAALSAQAAGPTPVVEVDLRAWLEEVATLLQAESHRTGVRIEVQASGRAVLSRAHLAPILIDLLANALRVSRPPGPVLVRGSVTGDGLRLEVEDVGPGFPEDLAERLRAACARGEVLPGEPGLGLGLPLVISRLSALGGRLVVERSDPSGVILVVRLPPATGPITRSFRAPTRP